MTTLAPAARDVAVGLLVRLPIRTTNPLNLPMGNSRQSAIIRARERSRHRSITRMAVSAALNARGLPATSWLPARITLTRVSAGTMDFDGLAASCKGIRDGIADALGVDDRDGEHVRWLYAQRKGPPKRHEVEVLLERGDIK